MPRAPGALPVRLAAAAALLAAGCVRRELSVTSEPPGALVTINGEELGPTPVSGVRFVHYGVWRVELRLDGHRTVIDAVAVHPPLWDRMGLDLLAGLAPWTVRDRRSFHYRLDPVEAAGKEEALGRAREAVEKAGLPEPPEAGGP